MFKPFRFFLFRKKRIINRVGDPWFLGFFNWRRTILVILGVWVQLVFVFMSGLFLSLPDVGYLRSKNPESTAFIDFRKEQAKNEGKILLISQKWVPFERIPEFLKQTVRLSEDAGFYGHHGIDFYELQEAIKKDLQTGKKARGGSTITMQLAKNLFLSPRKTYVRKMRELLLARKLEHTLSKNRIFHIYLNIVELGRGIFGFPAAAQHYYSKDLEDLSFMEILRLVAIMPQPLKADPRDHTRYIKWRIKILCQRLVRSNMIRVEKKKEILGQLK